MAAFLIESQHTARECVWAMRQLLRQGPESLEQYQWGCREGVHVAWSIAEADTKFDVLATVPHVLRSRTRIVEVSRFTPDEVMAFHEGELTAVAEPVSTR